MTAAAKNSSRCGPAGIGGDSLEVAALPGRFLPKLARAKARVPFEGWTGVTRREGEAMWFIGQRVENDGIGPSVRELAKFLGISTSTTDRLIVSLHAKQLIHCLPGRARALELRHRITQLTDQ